MVKNVEINLKGGKRMRNIQLQHKFNIETKKIEVTVTADFGKENENKFKYAAYALNPDAPAEDVLTAFYRIFKAVNEENDAHAKKN